MQNDKEKIQLMHNEIALNVFKMGNIYFNNLKLMQNEDDTIREEFDRLFPSVIGLLSIEYKDLLIKAGQTGVLFDIENNRREQSSHARSEEIKKYILSKIHQAQAERTREILKLFNLKKKVFTDPTKGHDVIKAQKIYGYNKAIDELNDIKSSVEQKYLK